MNKLLFAISFVFLMGFGFMTSASEYTGILSGGTGTDASAANYNQPQAQTKEKINANIADIVKVSMAGILFMEVVSLVIISRVKKKKPVIKP